MNNRDLLRSSLPVVEIGKHYDKLGVDQNHHPQSTRSVPDSPVSSPCRIQSPSRKTPFETSQRRKKMLKTTSTDLAVEEVEEQGERHLLKGVIRRGSS